MSGLALRKYRCYDHLTASKLLILWLQVVPRILLICMRIQIWILDPPWKFQVSLFLTRSDLGFESNICLVDIFSFGSRFVDPHIFADPDPDPGSQINANPTNLDPRPWLWVMIYSGPPRNYTLNTSIILYPIPSHLFPWFDKP